VNRVIRICRRVFHLWSVNNPEMSTVINGASADKGKRRIVNARTPYNGEIKGSSGKLEDANIT